MWCDGRRRIDLPPGARVEVRRGSLPVLLARLHGLAAGPDGAGSDGGDGGTDGGQFTDRLVGEVRPAGGRLAGPVLARWIILAVVASSGG